MNRVKRLLFFYLGVIALLILAAIVALAMTPPVVRENGVWYQAYWNVPETFDPVKCYESQGADFVGMCLEAFYEYDGLDDGAAIIPALAAEAPMISNDGRVYTIKLRPNVRYPDVEPWKGTPRYVTAHDFVFSLKRMADFHVASRHFDHFMRDRVVGANEFFEYTQTVAAPEVDYDREIEGVEALDDLTIRIELNEPFPQFIYKLMMAAIAPMPREWYELKTKGNTEPDAIRFELLGTGPYILESYTPEGECTFSVNPMYRGRPDVDGHPSGEGGAHPSLAPEEILPYSAKRVVFTYNREQLPRWYNFRLGLYDKSRVPRDAFGSAIGVGGRVNDELRERGVIQSLEPQPTTRWIGFAMDVDWIRENVWLRRAMSLAINRERHIEVFLNGDGQASNGIFPPSMPTYEPDYEPPYERYDPEEAQRLADRAKAFHLEKYGEPLPEFTYTVGNTSALQKQEAEAFRLAWRKIGLDVNLEFIEWGKFLEDLRNRQYECWRLGWLADYPDEEQFLMLFYSKNESPGPNSQCYSNPEFDRLYERIVTMNDSPERRRLYREMAEIIHRDLPVVNFSYDVIRDLGYDWVGTMKDGRFTPTLQDHVWLKAKWAYFHLDSELREARLSGGLRGDFESLVRSGQWTPMGDPAR